MRMKRNEAINHFGISSRSLHYWENAGLLQSSCDENDSRLYDEENIEKIKQIIFLRKIRLSLPAIQMIFSSHELSKGIAALTEQQNRTKKDTDSLHTMGIILSHILNMLKERQNIESVYQYLDTEHSAQTQEVKTALKTVFPDPKREIAIETPSKPSVDIADTGLALEIMTEKDIPEVSEVVRRCYANTKQVEELLAYYHFSQDLQMPECRWWYKLIQQEVCIGAVNLAYTGRDSMTIRNLAYQEPEDTVYIFELLKQNHPEILCWLMFESEETNEYCYPDCEMKKTLFREDNGFQYLTGANRRDQYQVLSKPFEQIYNDRKYRFARGLDETDDLTNLSWLRCSMANADWYDNYMGNWRITDSFVGNIVLYDNYLKNGCYYDNAMNDSDFRYSDLENSSFQNCSLKNCRIKNCDIDGMTIDGMNLKEELTAYQKLNQG